MCAHMHAVMDQAGEGYKKIWVTEFGAQAPAPAVPESGIIPVTDDGGEAIGISLRYALGAHARCATSSNAPSGSNSRTSRIREGNQETHWGLFAFRRDGDHPGEPWPRKDALRAYATPRPPVGAPHRAGRPEQTDRADAKWFPDTKHWLAGPFRLYWERNGGVERFGLPRTSVYTSAGRVVQIFERARFEFHNEFAGTPNEVLLSLLGSATTRTRTFPTVPRPQFDTRCLLPFPWRADAAPTPPPHRHRRRHRNRQHRLPAARRARRRRTHPRPTPPPPPPFSGMYFPETSHTLTGPFLQFWKQGGGLPVFGYPISEPIVEKNADDGKSYTVQYFERTRLEYHPEFTDNPLPVLEGLLGNDLIRSGGWWR